MPNAKLSLALGLAGCASAIAMPDIADPPPIAARSPAQLDEMLARYDRMHEGAARDALALRIDKTAAQRYATVSRLYWYTDLAEAEAAAHAEHKPILALRMLGRLDEDLSCANSRFFRATLYANKELSKYMKDNFVLYWSSERPVPRVTIDFGDGRKIESTTTGNSAHYILDEKGQVMDVLPGLYTPSAFRTELAQSLELARQVAAAGPKERTNVLASYHAKKRDELYSRASQLSVYAMRDGTRVSTEAAMQLAQRATMMKSYVEVPQLQKITLAQLRMIDEAEVATWASLADQLWAPAVPTTKRDPGVQYVQIDENITSVWKRERVEALFDAQSLSLVERLHGEAKKSERDAMLSRLAQHARADAALNQLRLRPQIHEYLASGKTDFATVNEFIYAKVFHTPKSDPWIGLRDRLDFTGLPDDGATITKVTAQR